MRASVFGTCDRTLIADIRRFARRLSPHFPHGRGTVNVVLVNDSYIHDLNRRFLGRDRPTNVLAFPPARPARNASQVKEETVGEVYVNRDAARRQARELQVTVGSELRRLALHGMLHLVGLSHRQMPPYEQDILGTD